MSETLTEDVIVVSVPSHVYSRRLERHRVRVAAKNHRGVAKRGRVKRHLNESKGLAHAKA